MRNLIYSITGLFLLSLLLVATSFASEAVIRHPSYGLEAYAGTAGSTEMGQYRDQDNTLTQFGLQPYWAPDESGMSQTAGDPDNTLRDFGVQPSWSGSPVQGMGTTDMGADLEPYAQH